MLSGTTTDSRFEHSEKSIRSVNISFGIVIEVKEVHPEKPRHRLTFTTLLGIEIEVKDEHPTKASYPILVTLSGI